MNPIQSDYQLPQVEGAPGSSPSDAPSIQVPIATTPPPAAPAPTDPVASASPIMDDSGLSAEDVDLIEKAWVEKAKAIVRSTEGDPYMQNKELNKVKADYIKKRYNRDIKVS